VEVRRIDHYQDNTTLMDDLIERIRWTACNHSETQWFDVVTAEHIAYVEMIVDVQFPELLKRCYTEIGNGGFGPGYGLTGLPGGYESSWGDLVQTTAELRELDDCEDGFLPVIDWGCAQMMCVDCDDDDLIVTCLEGGFHYEDYSFQTLLERWCEGKVPDLYTGMFTPERSNG
jgi:hypothetical protein